MGLSRWLIENRLCSAFHGILENMARCRGLFDIRGNLLQGREKYTECLQFETIGSVECVLTIFGFPPKNSTVGIDCVPAKITS